MQLVETFYSTRRLPSNRSVRLIRQFDGEELESCFTVCEIHTDTATPIARAICSVESAG